MTLSKDQGALKPCPFCGGRAEPDTDDLSCHSVRCMDCTIVLGSYSTAKSAAANWNRRPPLAAEPVGRWPFVESPVDFADRLTKALESFDGYMLGAVRNVLIENPPQLNSLPTLQSDLAQAQRQIKEWECSLSDYREKWNLVALENQKLAAERDKLQADLTEARAKVANLTADRDQLQMDLKLACNLATEAMALLTRYASECAECGGKGWFYVGEGVSGRGPDDVDPEQEHCSECADIREFLAKAKGAV